MTVVYNGGELRDGALGAATVVALLEGGDGLASRVEAVEMVVLAMDVDTDEQWEVHTCLLCEKRFGRANGRSGAEARPVCWLRATDLLIRTVAWREMHLGSY
jgi:hypothetical protein